MIGTTGFTFAHDGPSRPIAPTMGQRSLLAMLAREYDIPVQFLRVPDRSRRISAARHMAFYLLHRVWGMSLPEVGRVMGGFHHTSVLHGVRKIEKAPQERVMAFVAAAEEIKAQPKATRPAEVPEFRGARE